MKCSLCGGEATIKLVYANLKLCEDCFCTYIENRIKKKMRKFIHGRKYAVAVSGGKDSMTVLYLMKKLFPESLSFAFFIDLGLPGFSQEARKKVSQLASSLEVPLKILSLKEEYGFDLADIAEGRVRKARKKKVCRACAVVKRYLMNKVAWESGVHGVITGHNADDAAVTTVMNLFNIEFERLLHLAPYNPPIPDLHLSAKLKLLYHVREEEVRLYAGIRKIPYLDAKCPYVQRREPTQHLYKRMLDTLEERMPEIKLRILAMLKELKKRMEPEEFPQYLCERCGFPTVNPKKICNFCRIVEEVKG